MSAGPYSIGSDVWPGLSKLVEEMGETGQVVGKLIATNGETAHWDGSDLRQRLSEETADLAAAIAFVTSANGLNTDDWLARVSAKLGQFKKWHQEQNIPADVRAPEPLPDNGHLAESSEGRLSDETAAPAIAAYSARRAAGSVHDVHPFSSKTRCEAASCGALLNEDGSCPQERAESAVAAAAPEPRTGRRIRTANGDGRILHRGAVVGYWWIGLDSGAETCLPSADFQVLP